jgi:ubiquitin C-terminal hydrolase
MKIIELWRNIIFLKFGKKVEEKKIFECIRNIQQKMGDSSLREIISRFDNILKTTRCRKLGFLEWFKNSCFIDSVLMCLLYKPNEFVINMLTKKLNYEDENEEAEVEGIQEDLYILYGKLLKGQSTSCEKFRRKIYNYELPDFENFGDGRERDAGEFLKYLFKIFQVEYFKKKEINYGYNLATGKKEITSVKNINDASPMIDIRINGDEGEELNLSELLDREEDSGVLTADNYFKNDDGSKVYNRRIERMEYISYDYLVINIEKMADALKKKIEIIPEEELTIGKKKLELSGIVSWYNGHYICFIKCTDNWVMVDDTDSIKLIGNYDKLIGKFVRRNSKLYFYS